MRLFVFFALPNILTFIVPGDAERCRLRATLHYGGSEGWQAEAWLWLRASRGSSTVITSMSWRDRAYL